MHRVVAIVCAVVLYASVTCAGPENATARALVAEWKNGDPGMTLVAEVIASAFASGLAAAGRLGGREIICPPSDLGGKQIMTALERFVDKNPNLADQPYGVAMAASLSRAFPCAVKSRSALGTPLIGRRPIAAQRMI
jgi:hypothetical protein